jgi:hypothetical protein
MGGRIKREREKKNIDSTLNSADAPRGTASSDALHFIFSREKKAKIFLTYVDEREEFRLE